MTRVDRPVRVVDNGLRSFVPPAFCFELRDAVAGTLIATVSRVVLGGRGAGVPALQDFEAVGHLEATGRAVTGVITPYDAGPSAREPGLCFTTEEVELPVQGQVRAAPG
ncbi:hypothetical protein ABT160_20250 [Streptomyces sp. NPDC001941]|uniref:hypothetical protein n=1 Tax=Streptomyces sp. NPDC001941 TaxID=3154659 RepID=UPI0033192F5D